MYCRSFRQVLLHNKYLHFDIFKIKLCSRIIREAIIGIVIYFACDKTKKKKKFLFFVFSWICNMYKIQNATTRATLYNSIETGKSYIHRHA